MADGYEDSIRSVADVFALEPHSAVEVPPSALPVLLLLTADDTLAALVTEVARPVGLIVVRSDPLAVDVLEVATWAHVTVIDGRMPVDCRFVAGYSAGRGGRVICLTEPLEWDVPDGTGLRFCQLDAAELEREICIAAFLPVHESG